MSDPKVSLAELRVDALASGRGVVARYFRTGEMLDLVLCRAVLEVTRLLESKRPDMWDSGGSRLFPWIPPRPPELSDGFWTAIEPMQLLEWDTGMEGLVQGWVPFPDAAVGIASAFGLRITPSVIQGYDDSRGNLAGVSRATLSGVDRHYSWFEGKVVTGEDFTLGRPAPPTHRARLTALARAVRSDFMGADISHVRARCDARTAHSLERVVRADYPDVEFTRVMPGDPKPPWAAL